MQMPFSSISKLVLAFAIAGGMLSKTSFADDPTERWSDSIKHSIEFFDKAWDAKTGSYASEVDYKGEVKSQKRLLIAFSRMIYGLSYASESKGKAFDEADRLRFRKRAVSQAKYLVDKMVEVETIQNDDGSEIQKKYFVATIGDDGKPIENQKLIVNEQAYGLNGLVALYDVTRSEELKRELAQLYADFVSRFYDKTNGGFFDLYDLKTHKPNRSKSFNSTVYVGTAFLLEYARVMNDKNALELAAGLGDIVAKRFVQKDGDWIYENFFENWDPTIKKLSKEKPDNVTKSIEDNVPENQRWQFQKDRDGTLVYVSPAGHGFQAAWMLLRLADNDAYENARRRTWKDAAVSILKPLLKNAVDEGLDEGVVRGGIYDAFRHDTNEPMWSKNKAWWQQAEAILALTLADKMRIMKESELQPPRDNAISFYFKYFVDNKDGGEFSEVSETGEPIKDNGQIKDKGTGGKSTYHTVELARFMIEYLERQEPLKK